jgi:hypothetical protein
VIRPMIFSTSSTTSSNSESLTSGASSRFLSDPYLANARIQAEINPTVAATLATIEATLVATKTSESKPLSENNLSSSTPLYPPLSASYTSAARSRDADLPDAVITVTRRWEGSVLHIYNDGFFNAKLKNLADQAPEVTAEFSIEDLSDDDRSLLTPGATFYVTEGHERRSGGRIRRASDIRFRRLGRWSHDEIINLQARADQRRSALGFDEESE